MDLEKVEAFYGFLDFLADPDKFKKLIEETKQANQEKRDLIEKQRQIKNIDEWRLSEERRLQDLQISFDQSVVSHERKVENFTKRVDEFNTQMTEQNRLLNKRKSDLDKREKEIEKNEVERQKIDKLRLEYEEKLDNLRRDRDQLDKTMENIRIAAGG